jgi:hypothetical protein
MNYFEQITFRIQTGWERTKKTGDEFYLDGVALNLHSFYTALEKVFEIIAVNIDQTIPKGESWHQELLRQMASEIEFVRPPSYFKRHEEYAG